MAAALRPNKGSSHYIGWVQGGEFSSLSGSCFLWRFSPFSNKNVDQMPADSVQSHDPPGAQKIVASCMIISPAWTTFLFGQQKSRVRSMMMLKTLAKKSRKFQLRHAYRPIFFTETLEIFKGIQKGSSVSASFICSKN